MRLCDIVSVPTLERDIAMVELCLSGQAVAVSIGDIVALRLRALAGVRTAALVAIAVAAAVLADAVADFLDIFDFE